MSNLTTYLNVKKIEDNIIFYYGAFQWTIKWNEFTEKEYPSADALFQYFLSRVKAVDGSRGENLMLSTEPLAKAVINKLIFDSGRQ